MGCIIKLHTDPHIKRIHRNVPRREERAELITCLRTQLSQSKTVKLTEVGSDYSLSTGKDRHDNPIVFQRGKVFENLRQVKKLVQTLHANRP